MKSLTCQVMSNTQGQATGVDLVLSCVDNYEARMVVNQVTLSHLSSIIWYLLLLLHTIGNGKSPHLVLVLWTVEAISTVYVRVLSSYHLIDFSYMLLTIWLINLNGIRKHILKHI